MACLLIQSTTLMVSLKWIWLLERWDKASVVDVFSFVVQIRLAAVVLLTLDGDEHVSSPWIIQRIPADFLFSLSPFSNDTY